MKRRGNRRYYQHHEVLLIRRIRDLLYEQGFTISGARNQLTDTAGSHAQAPGRRGRAVRRGRARRRATRHRHCHGADEGRHARARPGHAHARDRSRRLRGPRRRGPRGDGPRRPGHHRTRPTRRRRIRDVGPATLHAVASVPAGQAGVRAAALQTRRTTPTASSAPRQRLRRAFRRPSRSARSSSRSARCWSADNFLRVAVRRAQILGL